MIPVLLLAAGRSSRMEGVDKLLQEVKGTPLLARMATRALELGPCFVTLPALDHPRRGVLPAAAQAVAVTGTMSDSLKAGIAALPQTARGVIILPADMPDITTEDLATLREAAQRTRAPIVRATTQDHQPGHPVYFAASQFPRFAGLRGDRGAAKLIAACPDAITVALPGNRARLDLDTPEDWAAYRAR
ncbi:nucleotidyltransferase family protein [Thalassorhabdomicrobium marinisediminis]|uniref:nucleotidyltransferase family protein n=1 Tax=Thalassorhabdomicrobium marinisediminis TaxID=2170577 RepID=UPI00248F63CD|nr:nucleotidyltransferase family protein [Thalassorhabdomicrobium marinisediminis]